MNVNKKYFSLLLGSFLVITSYAQDTVRYSLEQVVRAGLDSSHQTKFAEIKTKIAESKVRQIKDHSLPSLSATAAYAHVFNISPFMLSPTTGLPKMNLDVFVGMASANYEVFSALTEKAKEDAAQYMVKASQMDAEKDKTELEYNITAAYYSIYKIMRSEAIIDENIKAVEEREREAQSLVKGGVLLQNDLLKLQLQKSNLTLTKVDIENNLNVSLYNLGLLIGLPEGQVLRLDTTNLPLNSIVAESDNELAEQAIAQRAELKASDYRLKAAKQGKKALNVAYYPHVSAMGMYTYVNPALNHYAIPPTGGYLNMGILGATASYSFASFWNMTGKTQEVKLNILQAKEAEDTQRDQILSDVYTQSASYRSALEKIKVSEVALSQANESLGLSTSQFQNGLLLSGDLLQSQNLKLQAELSLLQSRVDAEIAYHKLQKAIGNHQ